MSPPCPRVLLHARPDAEARPGGDMVVLEQLRLGLTRLGCAVDVGRDPRIDVGGYDIVHLFNLAHLMQARHIEACARQALAQGVPYVITALIEDHPCYVGKAVGASRILRHYLDVGQPRGRLPELLRQLAQAPVADVATLPFVAEHAACVLAGGRAEQATVARYHPEVPTAIARFGSEILDSDVGPEPFVEQYGVHDFVLCVARLEIRKNQLMLLAALEDTDAPVVCVGGDFSFQPDYVADCRRLVRRAPTLFLGRLAPEMLVSAYRAASVHCLPSWYELPGLATLEAARYGAAVVASRWGTIEDYLGDACRYCEPDDPAGIRQAVEEALAAGPLPGAAERAAAWTWDRHAREVLDVYEAVLAPAKAGGARRMGRGSAIRMNPIDQISFVIATNRPSRLARMRHDLGALGVSDIVVVGNPRSIFEAYDTGRREARRDALCFIHDDVDVVGMDAELILDRLADPRTGFLGVAGSRVLDETGIWWRGINTPAQLVRLSGRCGHRQADREWLSEYGAFGEAVVLDGVCLFTTKAVLDAIGGFADPPLGGFDFYDVSATLRAHLAGYVNQTIPMELFHWGTGELRPAWDVNRGTFLEKYGADLPCALPGVAEALSTPVAASAATIPGRPSMTKDTAMPKHDPTKDDPAMIDPAMSDPPKSDANKDDRLKSDSPTAPRPDSGATPLAMLSDEDRREPWFELFTSRQFISWIQEQGVSLALTTYQAGKLFLLGAQPDGKLSVCERTFNRCMGLWGDGQTLWMTTLYQLWRFENALPAGQASSDGFDRLYVPQLAYTTGDIDIHDLAVDRDGRVVFVNTLFGCLALPSETHSFVPLWQPPFISRLAAEDRCHLNGLAMRDGQAAYVTCVSQSDVADGWRDRRRDGGVVVDVRANAVIARGLSMPHSPRWHQGRLWLLNSGTGFLGYVDVASGRFEPVAFCPGYLRGLSFVGDFAIIGSSKARENRTFQGLDLDDNLKARDADPRCGLYVVDLRTGDLVHWVRVEGIVDELYDVVVLPGVRRPKALGLKSDEIRRTITIGEGAAV